MHWTYPDEHLNEYQLHDGPGIVAQIIPLEVKGSFAIYTIYEVYMVYMDKRASLFLDRWEAMKWVDRRYAALNKMNEIMDDEEN